MNDLAFASVPTLRRVLVLSAAGINSGGLWASCSPKVPTFKSTDITGATFAQGLKLTDHTGQYSFKLCYCNVEGGTSTSYTMDHSAGKYVFDTKGRVRLFFSFGTEAGVIPEDIFTLLKSMKG